MTRSPLLALSLAACAPAYRPPAPFVPLIDKPGDLVASVQAGLGGYQADVAYAPIQGLEVRGGAQVAGFAGDGHYYVGTVGAGTWVAKGHGRFGIHADVGGGSSLGVTTVTSVDLTTGGDSVQEEVVYENGGALGIAALRGEAAYEGEHGAGGGQLGLVGQVLDSKRDGGLAVGNTLELSGFGRFGTPVVQVQGHAGLALPVFQLDEDLGVAVPILLGIGVVVNVPVKRPAAD